VGPRAVVDGVFSRLAEIGAEFSGVPEKLVAEDDTVVALGRYTWRQASTNEPAEVKMAHVWTLRDGKVIAFQQHVDTLKLQERSS
jgi:ketosteroid isomerase-like protein